jgi:hypothetical protein
MGEMERVMEERFGAPVAEMNKNALRVGERMVSSYSA